MIARLCWLIILIVPIHAFAQVLTGKVVDKGSAEPLIYANVGIINTDRGSTTNENGYFRIDLSNLPSDARVVISMIGYHSETFLISKLVNDTVIHLMEEPIVFHEVIVKPTKIVQLGTHTTTKKSLTGWGGFGVGAGGERGIKIESKKFPLYLNEVGVSVARNAYDSVLLRLHVRALKDGLPAEELVPENVYVVIKSAAEVALIDVAKFNLMLNEPFAISFEWVKAWGKCSGKSCFLQFSVNPFKGTLYAKEASAGIWRKYDKQSPAIFVDCSY